MIWMVNLFLLQNLSYFVLLEREFYVDQSLQRNLCIADFNLFRGYWLKCVFIQLENPL